MWLCRACLCRAHAMTRAYDLFRRVAAMPLAWCSVKVDTKGVNVGRWRHVLTAVAFDAAL